MDEKEKEAIIEERVKEGKKYLSHTEEELREMMRASLEAELNPPDQEVFILGDLRFDADFKFEDYGMRELSPEEWMEKYGKKDKEDTE